MPFEFLLIIELALLGICTGFLSGLLGIGGGMIMVPFLTFLLTSKGYPDEYTVKIAVATSLATICLTSLSSLRAHHSRGAVGLVLGGDVDPPVTGHAGKNLRFQRGHLSDGAAWDAGAGFVIGGGDKAFGGEVG